MAWRIFSALARWLVALHCFAATERPGVGQFTAPTGLEEGRRQYESLLAKVPEYGACWSDAVGRLERGCEELTEDTQGRLALLFTSCFLEKMGQEPLRCPESQPLSRCPGLKRFLNTSLAPSYVQFFTHTQVQKVLSRRQRHMLRQGLQLEEKVARSHSLLHEQRGLLDAGLLRLANVQAFFVEQFVTLHALAYYSLSVLLSLVMTASKRTAGARPWLLLLFLANMGTERLLCRWASDDALNSASPLAADSPLGQRIALCRQAVCLLALCVYVYHVYSFQDLAALNNQLLRDLQQELQRIRTHAPDAAAAGGQHDATTWRPPPQLSQPAAPLVFHLHDWADDSSESSRVSLGSLVEDSGLWSPPIDPLWWRDEDSLDDDSSSGSSSGSSMADTMASGRGALDQLLVKAEPGSELGDRLDGDTASCSSAPASSLTPAGDRHAASATVSPPPVWSPTSGRYNLRPRRSFNSSLDAIQSPAKPSQAGSGSRRCTTVQPRAVVTGATVLSSDEEQ